MRPFTILGYNTSSASIKTFIPLSDASFIILSALIYALSGFSLEPKLVSFIAHMEPSGKVSNIFRVISSTYCASLREQFSLA